MKNTSIIIMLGSCLLSLTIPVTAGFSQGNVNGVYLTEEDFKLNVLTDQTQTDRENTIEQELGKHLLLYRDGVVKKYKFGSVYGYYQSGIKYRAWQKRKWFSDYGFYRILNDAGFQIYSRHSSHHRSTAYTWYYYSKTPTSKLKRFTSANIENDFSAHPEFVKAVSEVLENTGGNLQTDSTRLLILKYLREKVKP
jgi:hypothetical protein